MAERTKIIGGHKVEEYYWSGKLVVYVDNRLQDGRSFEKVCEDISNRPLSAENAAQDVQLYCRCCTCGYSWQRGKSGEHSCSDQLLKVLESVRRVATGENQVANDDTDGMKWIADYIKASLGH